MTPAERRRLAEARANALALGLMATAAGLWEPDQDLLDALATLATAVACDLVWDLDVAGEAA